jgi:LmbE family N-acetylglucosaminyl deacetylase
MTNPVSLIALLLLMALPLRADEATTAPRQGAALLKTDIMGVFAHPDDETGMAATLAYYAHGRNATLAAVYCTRGEGGGNMVGTQWGPALGILREAELRACLKTVGVRFCYFLDQVDWAYTESAAMTLEKWNSEAALEHLVRLVRSLRPEVIVTMNPTPRPGQHGHHHAAGLLATEATTAAADPERFPDQIQSEGLSVWQVRKLYFTGSLPGPVARISVNDPLPNLGTPADIASEALSNHRSQAFGNFAGSTWIRRPQTFSLIKSAVPFPAEANDLLEGLPAADPRAPFLAALLEPQAPSPVALRFAPRPAIARFREWAHTHGTPQLAESLTSDIPLTAGEPNTLRLTLENNSAEALDATIEFSVPEGWTVEPRAITAHCEKEGTALQSITVTPSAGATTDVTLTASTRFQGNVVDSSILLHPLPIASVPRITPPSALTALNGDWTGTAPLLVTGANLVQGEVADAADSLAAVRLGHDGTRLYVEVDVTDQTVVSNIASNDIRGHWRSDSVEICIDPTPGAEHTLGAFKLGVFPFDAAGVVRAARDADADQGPVKRTAPGTVLASNRTATGYRILVSIPFSEIGFNPAQTQRLGFNVIVYDGDKADAAPGENINKSRIAWAPRSGVQGRPEDWGRIDLE